MTSDFLQKVRQTTEKRLVNKSFPLSGPFEKRKPFDVAQQIQIAKQPFLIAEVKRQSPSHGALALALDPVEVAQSYTENGAPMISVLTEPDHFKGSLTDLQRIREKCPEQILLMKDFVIDSDQIQAARSLGADAVLLIKALLPETLLMKFLEESQCLGLTPLVEVHTLEELEIALAIRAPLIGINNRSLSTLKVDIQLSCDLMGKASRKDALFISESGLQNSSDIRKLYQMGFQGFLMGTHLMKDQKPGQTLKSLLQDLL